MEDNERFIAPVHFSSVDPRRLHCKKFASIKKFVQENQVMRVIGCSSASESKDAEAEDAESNQSVSSYKESDAEEEKHGEMPELILSRREATIIRVK